MGNHHSHGKGGGDCTPPSRHSSNNSSKKGISRTASGADIQEKTATQLLPVERLAKVGDKDMECAVFVLLWLIFCWLVRREV